jgi:hypothetical protein
MLRSSSQCRVFPAAAEAPSPTIPRSHCPKLLLFVPQPQTIFRALPPSSPKIWSDLGFDYLLALVAPRIFAACFQGAAASNELLLTGARITVGAWPSHHRKSLAIPGNRPSNAIERELKGLILNLAHWVCTSKASSPRSNLHKYKSGRTPGDSYNEFKLEIQVKMVTARQELGGPS